MTQETIIFDTHRFVRNLMESGFTEKQAEALAYEQVNLLNSNLATKSDLRLGTKPDVYTLRQATQSDIEKMRLATQSDIEAVRLSTNSSIEARRISIEAKIERAKFETVMWLIGAMFVQSVLTIGVTVTLIKLL